MRRTPDKETIIKLRQQRLSFREIGRRFGVSDSSIKWALQQEPRKRGIEKQQPRLIPQHVIDYWRIEWGWSEDKINQTLMLYNRSFLRRNDN